MVLKKRLDYGFNGIQVPTIPRAPRSVRRRNLHKKTVQDSQICAFDLLASIAGQLLQESESSASSNASEVKEQPVIGKDVTKHEWQDVDKPLKAECIDKGSCEESTYVSELAKGFQHPESDAGLERTSIVTSSDCSEKVRSDVKPVICKNKTAAVNFPTKVEGDSPDFGESHNLENGINRQQEADELKAGGLTITNTCSSKDPVELYMKFPVMVNSDSKVRLPLCRDPVPSASFSRRRNNIKLGIRDDDENFHRCNKPISKLKGFRPPPRIGDHRIRKLLTSKYWKVAPKLKDCELSKSDGGIKPLYNKRKTCYNRVGYQRDTLYKRRKLFDQGSVVTSDGGFSSESVSNSPEKGISGGKSDSAAMLHGASAVSSSVIGHLASFHSNDSHVKFSIKSFRVPELFIEVPETATVGSLKRTVMEAVTAIIGGGLRVGVLLQGKKVKDDNRTLSQTGISCKDNLDALGFTLEPSPVQTPPVCSEDLSLSLPCDTPQPLTRPSGTLVIDSEILDALPEPPSVTDSGNSIESNHEPIASHTDILTDKAMPDSRAIVAVPAMNVEALAMVPMNQKTKRSELAQRRIRRPFSVSEVEALVQAVEELGTGRWRDVKLRAFENADHRTYVDLKDKWKTLVHTARISPQQRRGEPVPQELLDRVLSALVYWSQHQARHVGKQQAGTLKITEAQAD